MNLLLYFAAITLTFLAGLSVGYQIGHEPRYMIEPVRMKFQCASPNDPIDGNAYTLRPGSFFEARILPP